MLTGRFRDFLLFLALFGSSVAAFAVPGELAAVERRCGPPSAESKGISEVTNQLERTLIYYDSVYLHFQPVAGGWSFTTAWNGHLPMTRREVESRMPCFRVAMQDAASGAPVAADIDPTIASQTINRPATNTSFGIPHLWLIVALVVTLLVFLIWPSARQRRLQREAKKPVDKIYRKPNLDEYSSAAPPVEPIKRDLDR